MGRRQCLRWAWRAGTALAAAPLPAWAWAQGRRGHSEPIAIVIWGGPYIDGARPLFDAFTTRTGIPVDTELHAGGAMAVLSKISADLPRVSRDVVAAFDAVFLAMAKEGWLDEITPAKVPAMTELSPLAQFRDPASGKVVALGWTVAESGWFYRADLVPADLQPLGTVEHLLDPRLKGRIYLPPPISGSGTVLISLALARGGDEKTLEPGWQVVADLARRGQIGGLPKSDAERLQAIATGDGWVTWGPYSVAAALAAGDVPVARARSERLKSFGLTEGFSVMRASPRIEQAYEWMRFFYTPENIGRLTTATKQPPSHPKTPVDPLTSRFFLLTPEEQGKYMFKPDFAHVTQELNGWIRRFETDILPLLRHR